MYDFPASPANGQIFQPSGSGAAWQFDGTVWKTLITSQGVRAPTRTIFSTPGGPYTYVPPAGCTAYEVELQGGGGGGQGTSGSSAAGNGNAGSGGGGGGYGRKLIQATPAVLAGAKQIWVGGGGTSGLAGGNSQYQDVNITLTANGGGGGVAGVYSTNVVVRPGAAGGTVTAGFDAIRIGDPGGDSWASGASDLGATLAAAWGGRGGSSFYGPGAAAVSVGTTNSVYSAVGNPAPGYGSGGGGGIAINAVAGNVLGGAGSQGIVVITEYYTGDPTQSLTQALDTNLIVNPAIQIGQDGQLGALQTVNGTYIADQWIMSASGPTGGTHYNCIGYPPTNSGVPLGSLNINGLATAYASPGAGDFCSIIQYLEGNVIAALQWGLPSAIPAVLAFEMYAPVAGTFAAALRNAATDRYITFACTFSAAEANSWKRFAFAVPAITTGTWVRDASKALELWFSALCGSSYQVTPGVWGGGGSIGVTGQTNLFAVANRSLGIRNIGLYPDPGATGVAPPFKMPSIATELQRVQRYYISFGTPALFHVNSVASAASQNLYGHVSLPVVMRAAPTINLLNVAYTNASGLNANQASPGGFSLNMVSAAAGNSLSSFNYNASARL